LYFLKQEHHGFPLLLSSFYFYLLIKTKYFIFHFILILYLYPLFFLYSFDDTIIIDRILQSYNSTHSYFSGQSLDTSLGIRFNLILIDLYTIKENFFGGIPKEDIASLARINEVFPSVTQESHHCRKHSGSHVELLAVLVRQGVVLGILTIFSIFIFPIFIFFRGAFFENFSRWFFKCALIAVVCLLISSFGIQVLAYRMNVSFWAIFLCIYYSHYYRNKYVADPR